MANASDASLQWTFGDEERSYELMGRHVGQTFTVAHPDGGYTQGEDLTVEFDLTCRILGGSRAVARVRCTIDRAQFDASEIDPPSPEDFLPPQPLDETLDRWAEVLTGDHITYRWARSGELRRISLPTSLSRTGARATRLPSDTMRSHLLPILSAFDLELPNKTASIDGRSRLSWVQKRPRVLTSLSMQTGPSVKEIQARHVIEDEREDLLRISSIGAGEGWYHKHSRQGTNTPGAAPWTSKAVKSLKRGVMFSESVFDTNRGHLVSRWIHVEGLRAVNRPYPHQFEESSEARQTDLVVIKLMLIDDPVH
ncbi:MAG: hypothetical protein EA397_15010 [Deltaproteobacteria bacterium]|nr:MAG: hypothetical protein EA397_15010 [Deltaproteobacteria bacterium]